MSRDRQPEGLLDSRGGRLPLFEPTGLCFADAALQTLRQHIAAYDADAPALLAGLDLALVVGEDDGFGYTTGKCREQANAHQVLKPRPASSRIATRCKE